MSYVDIDSIEKSFGAAQILKGISFQVQEGAFVSLVGPSGCGKSTLLRLIAGLDSISAGQVMIDGKSMKGVSSRDRDIAFVFQSYALYPHMTVRDNLGFSLKMRGTVGADAEKQIRTAAETLGIEGLLDRYPRQLSGGQRQRVAMGRAIVRDPKVFLFDEPLSNLDAELRVRMRAEIRELHDRLDTTTIYVTHDQVEAMTMSDQIVVLRDGLVEQIGAPLELYDRPANVFVAGFIGSPAMNIFTAQISENNALTLEDGTSLTLSAPKVKTAALDILCGIRPEAIKIAKEGTPAVVSFVEQQGADSLIRAQMGPVELTILLHYRADLKTGQQVHLQFDDAGQHFFESSTGVRLTQS